MKVYNIWHMNETRQYTPEEIRKEIDRARLTLPELNAQARNNGFDMKGAQQDVPVSYADEETEETTFGNGGTRTTVKASR